MYCVYCGKDHDESVPITREHIVPYSIGGANAFCIQVCADSNSSLGGLVDKPFIESFVVRSKRFFFGLLGTDGTEPTLDLSGQGVIGGREVAVTYRITSNDKQLRIASPTVEKKTVPEGEQWSLSGDPESVKAILLGKLTSVQAKGGQITDLGGTVLDASNVDPFLKATLSTTLSPDIVKTIHFDYLQFRRFFAKLALAAGHYALGEPFSRSGHAQVLRQTMSAQNPKEAEIPGSRIWPDIEGGAEVFQHFHREDAQVLAAVNGSAPVFIASIFGIDAVIPLAQIETGRSAIPPFSEKVFVIDLPSRKLSEYTFHEYLVQRVRFLQNKPSDFLR
jgi:hypothetical protein